MPRNDGKGTGYVTLRATRQEEYDAFDSLPRSIRVLLHDAPLPISALSIKKMMRKMSRPEVIVSIEAFKAKMRANWHDKFTYNI